MAEYEQISILGEKITVEKKAKKLEIILKEIQRAIQDRDTIIKTLEAANKKLESENEKLKNNNQSEIVELGAFEESKSNHRPLIHIYTDWIGYEMFIKDLKFERLPKEKQDIYHEVWNKCIKPTYTEFCEQFSKKL